MPTELRRHLETKIQGRKLHKINESVSCSVNYSQGGIWRTTTQELLQLPSTPPRGHWDNVIVNLGYEGRCLATRRASQVKLYEWVASPVGTGNMSGKVFITVWGLTEHRGHLVLMIIKQYLFITKP